MSVFSKDEQLQILKDLIEIKTVNDNEIEVAKYLQSLLQKHGIKAEIDEIKGHHHRAN
ncbi:succinyl-diaminopimelate desuccinylase, partial [Pseudomonas aeruginosa]